ncbi:helix-turn-helix domain containing protein [Actinoplanes sp. Pm04-4]|uniref:Helix-turn-helix domain containing protein n=1 Tax=Paractinoplanes pyxinae TaxID=2997416 RepID=A0ABT4BCG7_9ACTN|nr:TetR/AcrR family transcriptional regulator [Actinoplanes pyxinae]MCY1144217.1 helix-turn-helix domain containing protein [Actinoplanes pyxinae]
METLRPQAVRSRERILAAAESLFRANGIGATGMDLVAASAPVSKRTLYKHFPDKASLVAAYLTEREARLLATGATAGPRERILAFFEAPAFTGAVAPCPFIAASVENPDPASPPHHQARESKLRVASLFTELAAELGVADAPRLGEMLALLHDGALARSQVLDDVAPLDHARTMAAMLLDSPG